MSKIVITYDTEKKDATCLIDGKMVKDFKGAHMSCCSEEYPGYIEIRCCSEDEESDIETHIIMTANKK